MFHLFFFILINQMKAKIFYNNISSILATCSVPITMQYDYNTFTYHIPVNNNMFKRQEIAVQTLSNLEINCSDVVVALKNIDLNSSKINRFFNIIKI